MSVALSIKKKRIIWMEDTIYIEHYGKILDVSNTKILISDFEVEGNDLCLACINSYFLAITGKALSIRRISWIFIALKWKKASF